MDFGDILDQWEKEQKHKNDALRHNQNSGKKANAGGKNSTADENPSVNPMVKWLNRYGVVDKDKISEQAQENTRMHDIGYLKALKPQAVIDLHQLTRDQAWGRLESFVTESVNKGLKKILIIHGKGVHSKDSDPVLGNLVRTFIEQDKRLGLSGHPDRNNGGTGATWVIIKN